MALAAAAGVALGAAGGARAGAAAADRRGLPGLALAAAAAARAPAAAARAPCDARLGAGRWPGRERRRGARSPALALAAPRGHARPRGAPARRPWSPFYPRRRPLAAPPGGRHRPRLSPPPLPRTNRTSLVPPLVLSGHAASQVTALLPPMDAMPASDASADDPRLPEAARPPFSLDPASVLNASFAALDPASVLNASFAARELALNPRERALAGWSLCDELCGLLAAPSAAQLAAAVEVRPPLGLPPCRRHLSRAEMGRAPASQPPPRPPPATSARSRRWSHFPAPRTPRRGVSRPALPPPAPRPAPRPAQRSRRRRAARGRAPRRGERAGVGAVRRKPNQTKRKPKTGAATCMVSTEGDEATLG